MCLDRKLKKVVDLAYNEMLSWTVVYQTTKNISPLMEIGYRMLELAETSEESVDKRVK